MIYDSPYISTIQFGRVVVPIPRPGARATSIEVGMGVMGLVMVVVEGVRAGWRVGERLALAIRLLVGRGLSCAAAPPVRYPVDLQDVAVLRHHLMHLGRVPTSTYQLRLRGKGGQGQGEKGHAGRQA